MYSLGICFLEGYHPYCSGVKKFHPETKENKFTKLGIYAIAGESKNIVKRHILMKAKSLTKFTTIVLHFLYFHSIRTFLILFHPLNNLLGSGDTDFTHLCPWFLVVLSHLKNGLLKKLWFF